MQGSYIDALLREIDLRAAGEAADSIYFGGGTPSRTSPDDLVRVTNLLQQRFSISSDAEFTLEANPEDLTGAALASWRELGVNRVSIGVQSFEDSELLPLGRVHGGAMAKDAIRLVAATGLRTSLDLILGLPNQTGASFRRTLDTAVDLGTGHISIYMLDLEEGSVLASQVAAGRVALPHEDLVAQLYIDAIDLLAARGFEQYEISNFARAGEQSKHNLHYWRREQYHGFGLGAHSFIGERRYANSRDLASYIDAPGKRELDEILGANEEKRERIFLRLRQPAGLDYEEVVQLCGQEGVEWIEQGVSAGWLRRDGARVALTPAGYLVSNELISQLF